MKTIEIWSHRTPPEKIITCTNGDKYDSKLIVWDEGKQIYQTDHLNVDSGAGRKDGKVEIVNGIYGALCFYWDKIQGKALYLFPREYWDQITSADQIRRTPKYHTLPSTYSNPLHGGKYIATGILIHYGKKTSDWSAGCLTIIYDEWKAFIDLFEIGDKIEVTKT